MEDTSMSSSSEIDLPGFRFHPTEEELLDFYLKNTVFGKKLRFDVIGCLNIYQHDPWDLPGLSKVGEREWYFFVPRECRKHGNGGRPNRTTERGFWKATGSDRKIINSNRVVLGLKKTLVFYEGRAPKGTKTDWIMNEYRLPDHSHPLPKDMVLCKIYRKATSFRVLEQRAMVEEQQLKAGNQTSSSSTEMDSSLCWQEDESLALSQQVVPLKREAPEDDGSGSGSGSGSVSEALQLQVTQKKPKPPPSPSSTSLQMPLGYDPLPELQLPITNQFDWTQDQLWTQFNSPWLQNWGHYANILNF